MSINIPIRDANITSSGYLAAPVATAATNVDYDSFYANWNTVPTADGYYLDVAYDNLFTLYVVGFQNLNVGLVLTYLVDSLTDNTVYYYRLRAYKNLDTSTNSNIITTTTAVIYTACATYTPYFNPIPVDGLMFLTCGSLFLTSGSLGHYVIEWNLGSPAGATQFVSGDDSVFDGDIQEEHPLVESVVFAGTLYPVIRYVYVNGIKYTAEWEVGSRYSPDLLTCLDPVIITSITCSTVYGGDTDYPNYKLTYDFENPGSYDKSRSLKYEVCPNMEYLAWSFKAEYVADQLEIYYCTALDPVGILVDNFIIGQQSAPNTALITNLYPINYPTNPRYYMQWYYMSVRFITDISGFVYAAGNYLRIVVTGSVLEPTNDATDWELKLLNFEASDLDFTFINNTVYKIADIPVMAYDATNCWYDVTYNTVDTGIGYSNEFLYKYFTIMAYNGGGAIYDGFGTNPIHTTLPWKTNSNWYMTYWYGPQSSSKMNLDTIDPGPPIVRETISISKTTSDFLFTFTDVDDYNKFKSNITSIQADADYIAWSGTNDTQYEYFKCYYIRYLVGNSIGDSSVELSFYFHLTTVITYDDLNYTINFTMPIPINNFVDVPCSTTYESIDQHITNLNTTKNYTIIPAYEDTHIRYIDPITLYGCYEYLSNTLTVTESYYLQINEVMMNNLFDMTIHNFCDDGTAQHPLRLYRYYDRLSFKLYGSHAERLANWKLERLVKLRTDVCSDTAWETVYETP